MRHRALVILLLLILSFCFGFPHSVGAQSNTLQNYRSDALGLALQYPADWKLREMVKTETIIAASEADLNAVDAGKQPSGLIFSITITSFRQISASTPDDFAAILKQITASPDAKPSPIRISGADGLFVDTQDPTQSVATRTVLLSIGRRRVAVIRGISTVQGWLSSNGTSGEQRFNDLTNALTFFQPPDSTDLDSVGRVLWQVQAEKGQNLTDLADLSLSNDGATLYVSDHLAGIWSVTTNGVNGDIYKPDAVGEFAGIGIRSDGTQIVADPANHLLWALIPANKNNPAQVKRFAGSKQGSAPGQFGNLSPRTFAFGIQGLLYVLDKTDTGQRIEIFDRGGVYVNSWDLDKLLSMTLDSPAISSDSDNFIYLVAKNHAGVIKINVAGAVVKNDLGKEALTGVEPLALALDRFGNIYVATSDQGILQFDKTGNLLGVIGEAYDEAAPPKPGQLGRPVAMTIEPENGLMYVADSGRFPQVVAFALNGNRMVNVTAGTKSGGQLLYGEVVNGEINANTFVYTYTFEGKAGDQITIIMKADQSQNSQLDSFIELLGPQGTKLAANDDAKTSDLGKLDAQIKQYRLPVGGTYTIRATRFGSETTTGGGAFVLSLDGTPATK